MAMGRIDGPTEWCPLELALDLIGGKWKGLILWYLGAEGALRHAELKRRLERVSQKVMTQQLRELERDGVIRRLVYPGTPPRVDYRLTELGEAVRPAIEALRVWADERLRTAVSAGAVIGHPADAPWPTGRVGTDGRRRRTAHDPRGTYSVG
jgi:DNA-binding HxlR family transcriptional regulator